MDRYLGLHLRRSVDRTRIAKVGGSPTLEISQTHRNGSDQVVGRIELDNLQDVRDLHYLLEQVIREGSRGGSDGNP